MTPKIRIICAFATYIGIIPISSIILSLVEPGLTFLRAFEFCVETSTFSVTGAVFPLTPLGKTVTIVLRFATLGTLSVIGYSALQHSLFQRVDRIAKEQIKNIRKKPINLFLSYRRSDTSGYSGRIYDRLSSFFGSEHVFMDLDKIVGGENFQTTINKYLDSCDAIVVIIGKNWIGNLNNEVRIQKKNDFVRYEIAKAIEKRISIFPVLVNSAQLPPVENIPPEISSLLNLQAIELTDSRWNYDVQKLIDAIENVRKRLI